MDLSQLISFYRMQSGLSLEEVGQAVGVSKSTVSRWESGNIKKIGLEKQELLSELFGIDVSEFLQERFFKPVLGQVRAGYDLLAHENFDRFEEVSKRESSQGDYFLEVIGDSMNQSRIHDGDLIYVKHTSHVNSGDIAVVLIEDQEATVKRVLINKDSLILEASNPDYEDKIYSAQEVNDLPIRIIGKVLSVRLTIE